MKNVFIIALMLCMLLPCSIASAEQTTEPLSVYEAFDGLGNSAMNLLSIYEATTDEDVQSILQNCLAAMSESQAGIMLVATDDSFMDTDSEEINGDEQEFGLFQSYETECVYLEEFGYSKKYRMVVSDNYMMLEDYTYNADGSQLQEHIRVETAYRIDTAETLALYTIYEESGALSSTGRFLVHNQGADSKCLFTRTLGHTTNLSIDLKLWNLGQEYEWDAGLLFPPIASAE